MNIKELEEKFLKARDDYLNSKIAIAEFSKICEEIFISDKVNNIDLLNKNNKLSQVIEAGMELSFYSTQNDENGRKWYGIFLGKIKEYKK